MITFSEAVEMIKESIEAAPEGHTYKMLDGESVCLYVHDYPSDDDEVPARLEPGCIVGDMIVRQHILTLEELYDVQRNAVNGKNSVDMMWDNVAEITGKELTDKARDFLLEVQCAQDHCNTWKDSLDMAREVVENGYKKYEEVTERAA